MTSEISMHWEHIKAAIKGRMAYRADFFISILIMAIAEFAAPLVIFLIYQTGASFPGWTMAEALLLQAVYLMAVGFSFPFFFGIVWNTITRMESGEFDFLLLRPRSPLYMAIVTGFDSEDLGRLFSGVAFFVIALIFLPRPEFFNVLTFILLFVLSLCVLFAFSLLMSGTAFKWLGGWRMYEIFHALSLFGRYPAEIFSNTLKFFLTFVIPIATISSIPSSILLGRSVDGLLIACGVSIIFLILSFLYWHMMLKNLTSAGG